VEVLVLWCLVLWCCQCWEIFRGTVAKMWSPMSNQRAPFCNVSDVSDSLALPYHTSRLAQFGYLSNEVGLDLRFVPISSSS
jgi:hypothetical protein